MTNIKILHTADWHLGVSSRKAPREEEHARFLSWLIEELKHTQAELLIHAGDVFDDFHPSARVQTLYYEFLAKLREVSTLRHVVIVGGNHDSADRLDAPEALLRTLTPTIHVVGGLRSTQEQHMERLLYPVKTASGEVQCVVLAVPYLHETRLAAITPSSDRQALTEGFRSLYGKLAERARARWPGVPLIATGHLTCYTPLRAVVDDPDARPYPIPIHMIDALGALSPSIFDHGLSYVALGHIHQHIQVHGDSIWYPGTPVPTTAVEAEQPSTNMLVTLDLERDGGRLQVEARAVPRWRQNIILSGTLEEVREKMTARLKDTVRDELAPYVYADIMDPAPTERPQQELLDLMKACRPGSRVVRYRERSAAVPHSNKNELVATKRLDELDELQVFEHIYRRDHQGQDIPDELRRAFLQLLAETEEDTI